MDPIGRKSRWRADILVRTDGRRVLRFAGVPNGLSGSACCRPACLRAVAAFSLVEIMVAVLVLGVALTGMVQGVTTALSSSKESELQTVAALFAAGQMETIRAEGNLRDGTTDGDCGEGLALYRWQQTLTTAGIDGLHEVTVIIENAKSGKPIYELRTLLFEVPDDSRSSSATTRRDTGSKRGRTGAK